jgi:predicted nucleic acid-binding protein
VVFSNSSPLVYLAALGDFDFLPQLFDRIAIPQAVFEEVVVGGSRSRSRCGEPWIHGFRCK